MSELNIPNNWCLPELGEVLDIQGGSQPPKSHFKYEPQDGYIRLLQIRDFGEKPVPTFVPLNKVSKFCVKEDVLIARYGASLGRIVTGMEGAYNVALAKVINENQFFKSRYLFYLLKTPILQTPLAILSRSAQNGFAKHEIAHIKLPLPPLAEQHRIVTKIEEISCELDKGIKSLKIAQQQLKVYRQAVLKCAFQGDLTKDKRQNGEYPDVNILLKQLNENRSKSNKSLQFSEIVYDQKLPYKPNGWIWLRNEALLKYVTSGSRDWKKYYNNHGSIFIRTQDIKSNFLDLTDAAFVMLPEKVEGKRSLVEPGDILMTITGANVGKVAVIPENISEAYVSQSVALMKLLDNRLSKYLWYYFQSITYGEGLVRGLVYGVGRPVLSLENMREVAVSICSVEEQVDIIQEIESRLSVCDKIEASIEQGLQQADALRQSILKRAFEGKLVPQDPNDEPASVLLERIKAERAASKPTKKARKLKEKA